MTTPVSKRIKVDRRSSFLDKIGQDMEEEEKKRKAKKTNEVKGECVYVYVRESEYVSSRI